MDLILSLQHAHWLQVAISTLAVFALGGLWYSPMLFLTPWMKELGINMECNDGKKPSMLVPIVFSLLLAFLYALGLDIFFGANLLVGAHGGLWGLLLGVVFVAAPLGINYAYEGKSFRFFLISAGYHVMSFGIVGLILGLWK